MIYINFRLTSTTCRKVLCELKLDQLQHPRLKNVINGLAHYSNALASYDSNLSNARLFDFDYIFTVGYFFSVMCGDIQGLWKY